MRFPRNFWKRGQSAYELSCRAERVTIPQLHAHPKNYLSLRESTKVLGVSHQTLTKWTTDKIVRRDGPGGKFAVGDLISFLHELEKRAKEPPPIYLAHWAEGAFRERTGGAHSLPSLYPRPGNRLLQRDEVASRKT